MAESISRRLLIRDFGAGWLIRLWFDKRVRSLQITEVLRYRIRSLSASGSGIAHDGAAAEQLFDGLETAIRQLLALEGRRLRAEIATLREQRERLRQQRRGWRGLRMRMRSDRFGEISADAAETERKLCTYEKQLARLGREQVGVEPLPDQIRHHGRLALGASLWVLDWADRAADCPLSEYVIGAETIELPCRSGAGGDAEATFRYAARPADTGTTWPGPLAIEMRRDGPAIPSPFGLSVYVDLAEASAERMRHLAMCREQAGSPETPSP